MANFEPAVEYVLKNEDGEPFATDDGDFTNDPADPGGATKFGVTLLDLQEWRGAPSLTQQAVKDLTKQEALEIIQRKYWVSMLLEGIESQAAATAMLDMGYNKGKHGWGCQIQDFLGVNDDGIWGAGTIAAINNSVHVMGEKSFIGAAANLATISYNARIARNPRLAKFKKGWMARAERLLTLVQE